VTDQPHALYRAFDINGQLLYVGISVNPTARFNQHRAIKPWWTVLANMTVEWHKSREAALDAERDAIIAEKPIHNIMHNSGDRSTTSAPGQAVWLCGVCDRPVADAAGYVQVDKGRAALKVRKAIEAGLFDKRGDCTGTSELIPWVALHSSCDLDPDSADYWMRVERIRTREQIQRFGEHVSEKRWGIATDWDDASHDALAGGAFPTGAQT